nr:unnamed protein product [Callosobruchus analis]
MANQPSFIKEFIEIYHRHNCLWQVKSPAYANKFLRSQAYEELLLVFKTVDNEATVDAVKNKINNIRSAFRKELKKVRESKRGEITALNFKSSILRPVAKYLKVIKSLSSGLIDFLITVFFFVIWGLIKFSKHGKLSSSILR